MHRDASRARGRRAIGGSPSSQWLPVRPLSLINCIMCARNTGQNFTMSVAQNLTCSRKTPLACLTSRIDSKWAIMYATLLQWNFLVQLWFVKPFSHSLSCPPNVSYSMWMSTRVTHSLLHCTIFVHFVSSLPNTQAAARGGRRRTNINILPNDMLTKFASEIVTGIGWKSNIIAFVARSGYIYNVEMLCKSYDC